VREDVDLVEFIGTQLEQITGTARGFARDDGLEDAFTETMLDHLVEAGETADVHVCHHSARGLKVNGYGINLEQDSLDLYCAHFLKATASIPVPRSEIELGFRRLRAFATKCFAGYQGSLIEPSAAFDMAREIQQLRPGLARVRLFFLTDGVANLDRLDDEEFDGLKLSRHVWDARRVFRLVSSGRGREPLEIEFNDELGGPLACLPLPGARTDYKAFLVVIPGYTLARIYETHGTRLLERNVRAFLQGKGKVNRKIRETILKEPERFFAYNNGVSATASEVEFGPLPAGGLAIAKARDFQIVNGGQTTASLYHALVKDKADLSKVAVQAKLVVVNPAQLEALVPLISRYANSQNKVNETDLSANEPFHVRLEELSRTIWAPPAPGQQRNTRWFYERARGQYQDAQARLPKAADRRAFAFENPPRQRFTKTDIAKYENTWWQIPHAVSRGAEKNYWEFNRYLAERGVSAPDEAYFRRLVAKAILFKEAERIVQSLEFGGYRANIVTYSLAWLAHATAMRVDLDRVWREQGISAATERTIEATARLVHESIISPPGGRNVTEWCKHRDCWDRIRMIALELPPELAAELLPVTGSADVKAPTPSDSDLDSVRAVPTATWQQLRTWARTTGGFEGERLRALNTLMRRRDRGTDATAETLRECAALLATARRLGFDASASTAPNAQLTATDPPRE
jgi:hypothetical protein